MCNGCAASQNAKCVVSDLAEVQLNFVSGQSREQWRFLENGWWWKLIWEAICEWTYWSWIKMHRLTLRCPWFLFVIYIMELSLYPVAGLTQFCFLRPNTDEQYLLAAERMVKSLCKMNDSISREKCSEKVLFSYNCHNCTQYYPSGTFPHNAGHISKP